MRTHSHRLVELLSCIALAALLPACGGGADNQPDASVAELPVQIAPAQGPLGVFGGTIARGSVSAHRAPIRNMIPITTPKNTQP